MLDTDKAGPAVDLTSALKASRSNAPPPFWQTGRYSRTARRPSVLPTRLTGLEVIGLWEIKCATDTLSSKGRGSFDIEFCPKTCSSKTLVWLYYFRNCLGKVCSSNFDRDMAKRVTVCAHWLVRNHTSRAVNYLPNPKLGPCRDLNSGPPAPKAGIIPLDHMDCTDSP